MGPLSAKFLLLPKRSHHILWGRNYLPKVIQNDGILFACSRGCFWSLLSVYIRNTQTFRYKVCFVGEQSWRTETSSEAASDLFNASRSVIASRCWIRERGIMQHFTGGVQEPLLYKHWILGPHSDLPHLNLCGQNLKISIFIKFPHGFTCSSKWELLV